MDGSSTLGAPQETLEAAIYKTTITRVVPKCSTCGCYCQTKKSQREGIHHICDAQHKKPLCSALSKTKVARGKQKVSGAGRTLWSKMLNVWKVGGGQRDISRRATSRGHTDIYRRIQAISFQRIQKPAFRYRHSIIHSPFTKVSNIRNRNV